MYRRNIAVTACFRKIEEAYRKYSIDLDFLAFSFQYTELSNTELVKKLAGDWRELPASQKQVSLCRVLRTIIIHGCMHI